MSSLLSVAPKVAQRHAQARSTGSSSFRRIISTVEGSLRRIARAGARPGSGTGATRLTKLVTRRRSARDPRLRRDDAAGWTPRRPHAKPPRIWAGEGVAQWLPTVPAGGPRIGEGSAIPRRRFDHRARCMRRIGICGEPQLSSQSRSASSFAGKLIGVLASQR